MSTRLFDLLDAPNAPLPVRMVKIMRDHLALLLLADLALGLVALPAAILWIVGLIWLVPWIAVLTLAPVWAATSAVANSLVRGETVTWRDFLQAIRRHWRVSIGVSALPALVVTLFMGTWLILQANPHETWLMIPLFADGFVATCLAIACLSAFSLATSRPLRGWRLWRTALAMTTLRAGALLGTLAIFVALGLLLAWLNIGLVPLLPAPLAVCLAAIIRQTCERLERQGQEVCL